MCWDIKRFIESKGVRRNGYNISLYDISSVILNILWYQLIPNTKDVRTMLIYNDTHYSVIHDVLTCHLFYPFVGIICPAAHQLNIPYT
jgi:hypothetical protein